MKQLPARMQREQHTVEIMIQLFCRLNHGQKQLCPECAGLQEYARTKLERCPFQEKKPTCAKCQIHCYKPEMRLQIRKVMRFSGPRMLFYHPVLAVRHLIDGRRNKTANPVR